MISTSIAMDRYMVEKTVSGLFLSFFPVPLISAVASGFMSPILSRGEVSSGNVIELCQM